MEKLRTPLMTLKDTFVLSPGKEAVPLSQTTGVILSGGLGMRMGEVTLEKIPKHILPFKKGSSILENPVMFMRQAGIPKIYIITSLKTHDKLIEYTKKTNNFDYGGIHYIVEDNPKGPVYALRTLIKETNLQKPLIKANGDEVFEHLDIKNMYDIHVKNRHPITCLLTNNPENPEEYQLWINNQGRVEKLEKYSMQSASQGGYFKPGVLIIDPSQFYLFDQCLFMEDFIKKAIGNQALYGYVSP